MLTFRKEKLVKSDVARIFLTRFTLYNQLKTVKHTFAQEDVL